MPNRIHLLEEIVANQIAAGEVIERPASALKELVENSLDAGATRIDVEVESGGRRLIRVSDNGCGMSRDDALLCLERHATSKVRTSKDITAIGTFGFRGEAMPSIASVSYLRLRTAEPDAPVGTEIYISGGKIESVNDVGVPAGTQIEIKRLFFNTPARKKFLKSDETESAHMEGLIRCLALAHPEVAWSYREDGRVIYQLPAVQDPLRRVRDVCGAEFVSQLIPVQGSQGSIELSGWIGRAGISRSSRADEIWFVNQRPVDSKTLYYSIREGAQNALMKGRHPVAVLFLTLPPEIVDVNVHPAKREVRFRDEALIRRCIVSAVREALQLRQPDPLEVSASAAAHFDLTGAEPMREISPLPDNLPIFTYFPASPADDSDGQHNSPSLPKTPFTPALEPEPSPFNPASEPVLTSSVPPLTLRGELDTASLQATEPTELKLDTPLVRIDPESARPVPSTGRSHFRVLGIIHQLYIIAESPRGLVLIDQHAAHERVLFEQVLKQRTSGAAASQRLLQPVLLDLSPREFDFAKKAAPALEAAGLDVSEFGRNCFAINAVPPFFPQARIASLVQDILAELQAEGGETKTARHLSEEVVTRTVCRMAIKANDRIRSFEIDRLIEDLLACDLPYTCPHGRPTMILMTAQELEKKFGRVQ